MQIKMFVIKPTDHNGFLAAVLMVLAATEMDFSGRIFKKSRHKVCFLAHELGYFTYLFTFLVCWHCNPKAELVFCSHLVYIQT